MSRYLLDTNTLLFLGVEQRAVSADARERLSDPYSRRWISPVSAIEIAIKSNLGKLALPRRFAGDFVAAFHEMADKLAATVLDLDLAAIARLQTLPLHHRDPFDRLLIAQAMEEDLTLVSTDRQFAAYQGLKLLAA